MAACRMRVIARAFSTSPGQQQLVKPPIQVFGIEGRYATALFSAASKQNQLDTVEKELVKFKGTLKTDVKLREFIENPTLKRQLKVEGLKQVSSKFPLSSQSTNLLLLLAENGRLKSLDGIIGAYQTIMAAHRGEVPCEVITAKPLDDALKTELEAALKSFLKQGQKLQLNVKVDPTIIGGMIVSIGDKYVDMSIATKIKKYTDVITAVV
ncbi:ATP synthase subunit O, mitochondrial [Zootermopsis nevadensis]|uniref:Oligomycin sensitivity conferral protein n=1 Tax=Zootermopsis nevadensis TaxID=136037 RepID=A0A067RFX8_ZOONE|nr:ATP synthase subunit O, mitochondrial [Zootermopsis nevadensis]KDR22637.1 ATP synthase subunit O, mitochondrial [Zootermopsis nevadensis]